MPVYAAGYLRVSTDLQDRSSLQQRRDLEEWAKSNDRVIVEWFCDEGRSGTTFLKRPDFVRLAKVVENSPKFSEVLVWDESRWSRTNPRHSIYWKERFREHGVTVKVINSRADGSDSLASLIQETLESHEAGEYSLKLSRSTFRGAADNALQGYSAGGFPPIAYERAAVDAKTGKLIRKLVPGVWRRQHEEKVVWKPGDPKDVKTVRRIFQMKIDGHGVRAIADILNREGIPCPRTGRWKNSNQKWSSGTVRTILRNPAYYGARVYNRHPQSHLHGPEKEAWENLPEKWVVKENAHPAIISKETWLKANDGAKPYERRNRFFLTSSYLLSGLIVCKRCGFKYHGITKTVRSKGYKRGYYVDSGYHTKGRSVCGPFMITQDEIERRVMEAVRELVASKAFRDDVVAQLQQRMKAGSIVATGRELRRRITINRQALAGLLSLIEAGTAVTEVKPRIEALEREKRALEQQLQLPASDDRMRYQSVSERVMDLLRNFERTMKSGPIHIQKAILKRFVDRIVVDPTAHKVVIMVRRMPSVEQPVPSMATDGVRKITLSLNGKKDHSVQSKN